MGKKQFALLLLVFLYPGITTKQAQARLGACAYKTVQAALNKLVIKNLLYTKKQQNKLFYILTGAGEMEISPVFRAQCSLEMARELYG